MSKARIGWIALIAVLLWLPQYAEAFWMQTGLFAMSAAIGAIGLTLLVGTTGQLSLAAAFFVGIGAYGYCYFAGESGGTGTPVERARRARACHRCWRRSWPSCSPAWPAPRSARSRRA